MARRKAQHGTPSGYTTHYTVWNTPPCDECKEAQNRSRNKRDQDERDTLGYNPKRLKNHNLTVDFYFAALAKFDGKCWLCQEKEAKHIDHDHSCCPKNYRSCGKCFRGLLCSNCNTGLGLFKDDPVRLNNALSYIVRKSPVPYNI